MGGPPSAPPARGGSGFVSGGPSGCLRPPTGALVPGLRRIGPLGARLLPERNPSRRAELSGRKVKRSRAGASQVERRSERPPSEDAEAGQDAPYLVTQPRRATQG